MQGSAKQKENPFFFCFAEPPPDLGKAKVSKASAKQKENPFFFCFAEPLRQTWAKPKCDLEQSGRVVLSVVKLIIPSSQLLWDGIEGVSECFLQVPQSG
ncbi:MAG: hypothetical protein IKU63_04815 [Bacteroidaceae bacterium]|nr:hypothetical protein [Bacteroidaceae bacterium]